MHGGERQIYGRIIFEIRGKLGGSVISVLEKMA